MRGVPITVVTPPCPKCGKRRRGVRYGNEATVLLTDDTCCGYKGPIRGDYLAVYSGGGSS